MSHFSASIISSRSTEEVFQFLLKIEQWWSGLYSEHISGKSQQIGDEFEYSAADGLHYSKHKLVELIPNKRIVWLVTESKLQFLSDKSEWNNTRICFDISQVGDQTKIVFTHEGLVPEIECYANCSVAWTHYLEKLQIALK